MTETGGTTRRSRAFFFPHAREFSGVLGNAPGRVPFDIQGVLVTASDVRTGSAVVCADGYGRNQCASNQDPCVFSAPLGPVHSFCRLDNVRGKDHYVLESSGTQKTFLSNLVLPGDLVIYGKAHPPAVGAIQRIWVDTVLVVKQRVRWPTSVKPSPAGKCSASSPACKERRMQHGSPTAFAARLGASSSDDIFKFNLQDAAPDGAHCCTENKDPHVIAGAVNATSEALTSHTTSFVPLAETDDDEWWPAFVEPTDVGSKAWADLIAFFDAKVRRNPRSGFISEMDHALAITLVDAIVAVSGRGQGMAGTVAIPPLTPSPGTQRWSPTARAFSTP